MLPLVCAAEIFLHRRETEVSIFHGVRIVEIPRIPPIAESVGCGQSSVAQIAACSEILHCTVDGLSRQRRTLSRAAERPVDHVELADVGVDVGNVASGRYEILV